MENIPFIHVVVKISSRLYPYWRLKHLKLGNLNFWLQKRIKKNLFIIKNGKTCYCNSIDEITLLFVGLDLSIKQVEKESHWLKCSFYCGPQWVCNTTLWDWLRKLLLHSQKILFGHWRFPRVRFSARIDLEFWLAPCALYQSSDWLLVLYT